MLHEVTIDLRDPSSFANITYILTTCKARILWFTVPCPMPLVSLIIMMCCIFLSAGWAHVVCALYIPEVRFGNVTTMEPIILASVPHDRFCKVSAFSSSNTRDLIPFFPPHQLQHFRKLLDFLPIFIPSSPSNPVLWPSQTDPTSSNSVEHCGQVNATWLFILFFLIQLLHNCTWLSAWPFLVASMWLLSLVLFCLCMKIFLCWFEKKVSCVTQIKFVVTKLMDQQYLSVCSG